MKSQQTTQETRWKDENLNQLVFQHVNQLTFGSISSNQTLVVEIYLKYRGYNKC